MHICLQAGHYYLFNGGTADDCPYSYCLNAERGQKYTPGYAVTNDTCPTKSCANKPARGHQFATAGSCEQSKCSAGERGTYYKEMCAVGNCVNGNVRFGMPTRLSIQAVAIFHHFYILVTIKL